VESADIFILHFIQAFNSGNGEQRWSTWQDHLEVAAKNLITSLRATNKSATQLQFLHMPVGPVM
jgi:hypothetical protein